MARTLDAFPTTPRQFRSKFDRFLDGQTWELAQGVLWPHRTQRGQVIYRRGRAGGGGVKIRRDERKGTLTVKRMGSREEGAARRR